MRLVNVKLEQHHLVVWCKPVLLPILISTQTLRVIFVMFSSLTYKIMTQKFKINKIRYMTSCDHLPSIKGLLTLDTSLQRSYKAKFLSNKFDFHRNLQKQTTQQVPKEGKYFYMRLHAFLINLCSQTPYTNFNFN